MAISPRDRGTVAPLPRSGARPLIGLVLLLALGGCGGDGAAELLETARLEELQNNPTHARQLYQEIVDKYPGTPQAGTAAARLREMPPDR